MKILTGTQHAELDRLTIENEPIASIDLMERAAIALTHEIMSRWDRQRIVYVFAGQGNNGGDGLAVARLLAQNGYRVVAYLFNIKNHLSEDCETNRDRLLNLLEPIDEDENRQTESADMSDHLIFKEITQGFDFPKVRQRDVVVDALFGTGLSKPLSGGFAVVARKINTLHTNVVSIDIPSGLMCEDNSFTDHNTVVHATLTLTIQLPKLAFLFAENEECVGEWKALDINLSKEGLEQMSTPYSMMELAEVKELFRPRSRFAHKGTMGHALLVTGCYGMAGAAQLAGKACLRSGVGKLTIHTPSGNSTILQVAVPEAVLSPDSNKFVITETIDTSHFQAIGIGPGIGQDEQTAQALQQYIVVTESPIVLDADALNIIGKNREWLAHIPAGSILTPHVKELENLIGRCDNSFDRLTRTSEMAVKYRIYLIIKGHYTAICTPQGRILFCPRGNAGMATPGSGDVLTGIITGLLAQGYTSIEASMLGVWLHASAGDLAAEELSEECMLSSDIISHLGGAIKELKTKS